MAKGPNNVSPRIQWPNLWKWCCLLPGTKWARVTLTLWQVGLVSLPALGGQVFGWWGIGGGIVGGFFAHELFFELYSEYVARVPVADDGDVVGTSRKSDYTYERWIGPVC